MQTWNLLMCPLYPVHLYERNFIENFSTRMFLLCLFIGSRYGFFHLLHYLWISVNVRLCSISNFKTSDQRYAGTLMTLEVIIPHLGSFSQIPTRLSASVHHTTQTTEFQKLRPLPLHHLPLLSPFSIVLCYKIQH